MKNINTLHSKSATVFRSYFQEHPFLHLDNIEVTQSVLGEFYGVSEYFPYLQAIACSEQIETAINACRPLPSDIALTSVVGTFLTWDEFGGHHTICKGGQAALPNIINTNQFHASMFKQDMQRVFGPNYQPTFTSVTTDYLRKLKQGLGAVEKCERVAHMVAFEMHAESMLTALYLSLKELVATPEDGLTFFEVHIGEDDPAEAYHVEMTNRLINALIAPEDEQLFLEHLGNACKLHHEWSIKVMGV